MSRDDPQFKLRMPASLRAQAEQAAKTASRSLNAELVARLEASYLSTSEPEELMTAQRARELAAVARDGLPEEIRRRALKAVNRAVGLGHNIAGVGFDDLHLGEMENDVLESLVSKISEELTAAGYEVDWDDVTWLWIKF